jgi:hypothetical protein
MLSLMALAASPLACVRENPAFDANEEFAEGSIDTGEGDGDGDTGDGDGDTGDGDGDGDSGDGDTGDGDGDTGDGDGDTGDGDGDTGDGDGDTGDGDGDTGDGDGDTGDGDGDGDVDLCVVPLPPNGDVFPFQTHSLAEIQTTDAPNFHLAPENCHLLMFCRATQDFCDPMNLYMAKVYSNGMAYVGESYMAAQALQLRFHPGGGLCDGSTLNLDPSQSVALQVWNGQAFEWLPIRLPCLKDYNIPLYIAEDGSTYWDIELTDPAALWD